MLASVNLLKSSMILVYKVIILVIKFLVNEIKLSFINTLGIYCLK